MITYLGFIEHDGNAWGGTIPELRVTVAGKDREQVLTRLREGAAFQLWGLKADGLPIPPAQLRSAADLPADDQDDYAGMEAVMVEPAQINAISVAVSQALDRSGLSDSEVARRMGTSPAAVSRLKDFFYTGHSLLSLTKLAQALNVPLLSLTGMQDLALDEWIGAGDRGMMAPGYVTLRRTPELEQINPPALVRWDGMLFWLSSYVTPPARTSDETYLRFEGGRINEAGHGISVYSA